MTAVCRIDQLTAERGVAALVGDVQVAVFQVDGTVLAVDHRDPRTGANVMARGIVGTQNDRWYVASPLHKERYDLATGVRIDGDGPGVRTWPVHVVDGVVHIEPPPSG